MAEGDLYKLLKRVNTALARDMDSKGEGSARFRTKLGRLPHDLILRRDDIRDEILIQIRDFMLTDELKSTGVKRADASGKMTEIKQAVRTTMGAASGRTREASRDTVLSLAHTAGMTPKQIKAIETEADRFITIARAAAKMPPPSLTAKILKDSPQELIIRFTPKRAGNTDVYARINDAIFKKAKETLTRNLSAVGFPIDKKRGEIFFNIGHITSVSELKAAQALNTVSRGLDRNGSTAADVLRTELAASFTKFGQPEFQKRFLFKTASVSVESQATNLTDSDYEKALLMDVRNSLKAVFDKMPVEWANEKSSPSLMDAILDGVLHETFRNTSNLRVTGLSSKANLMTTSAVISDFKSAVPTPKGKTLTTKDFKTPVQIKGSAYQSLDNLLPLINQRLPEVIRSHMGTAGRLKNRTGRFSESAQVVKFSEIFGMAYTYQRNPYEVFEADSDRDPRPLIEMSIREIAIGLTRERFGLRRV